MAHLLNFPGDIKSNPVDASKMVVLKPTEKDIVLPDIKMLHICTLTMRCSSLYTTWTHKWGSKTALLIN